MSERRSKMPIIGATFALLWSGVSSGAGEVVNLNTELVAATPSSYTLDGNLYEWGLGNDRILKSFTYNSENIEYNKYRPDFVVIRRVANSVTSGAPCSIHAARMEHTVPFKYRVSYQGSTENLGDCNYAKVLSGENLYVGTLDLFSNTSGDYSKKNIERVDLIFENGVTHSAEDLSRSGYLIMEKSGNNHVQIAAITGLGDDGHPVSYGSLVMIYPETHDGDTIKYGKTNIGAPYAQLSSNNQTAEDRLREFGYQYESLGAAFVTATDLGLSAAQPYFGVSLFPADVDEVEHDLAAPKTFPLDTGIDWKQYGSKQAPEALAGDADIVFGTAGEFLPVTTNNSGDGEGGAGGDTGGVVAGSTETKEKEIVDVVETRLEGGAGGAFGAWLLPLLAALGLRTIRRRVSASVAGQQI